MYLEGRVIYQNIDPSESPNHLHHRFAAKRPSAYIARDQFAPSSFALNRLPGRLCILMLVEIKGGDIGAFACEENRHGPADSGVGTRHDRDFVFQFV